ncbi:MAG: hypothetical protein AAF636_21590, partial [Pseudomonadota bacterium]
MPLYAPEPQHIASLDLVCPPDVIFDTPAFKTHLDTLVRSGKENADIRREVVGILREAQREGRARIA